MFCRFCLANVSKQQGEFGAVGELAPECFSYKTGLLSILDFPL